MSNTDKKISEILIKGGIGVLATDTLYGLVGLAFLEKTVRRIYKVRKRNPKKPFIILISSLEDLVDFGINLNSNTKKLVNKFWPGKVSIILACLNEKYAYLHRGANTLAFRMPVKKSLIKLLKETGPLVAPSANPEGLPPAKTIQEAKNYFKNKIDFYVDEGFIDSSPSTVIRIKNNRIYVERKGAIKIKKSA